MAAAIKALNAKIRANPYTDYLFSTHFLGPASNFGIPLAAVMDTQKDPEIISGTMTAALIGYSGTFMRYAFAVTPRNYLLFGCHAVNFSAQLVQGYRYLNYWNFGGRELSQKAKSEMGNLSTKAGSLVNEAKAEFKQAEIKAKELAGKVTGS